MDLGTSATLLEGGSDGVGGGAPDQLQGQVHAGEGRSDGAFRGFFSRA